jgi:hypothetical protein
MAMSVQKLGVTLAGANLVLLLCLLGKTIAPVAAVEAASSEPQALRVRSLELVDEQDRVRALLAVMPPTTVDGKDYPETVLFRLIDPQSGPVVKIAASKKGSGLLLSDDAEGGVQVIADDERTFMKMVSKGGVEKMVQP